MEMVERRVFRDITPTVSVIDDGLESIAIHEDDTASFDPPSVPFIEELEAEVSVLPEQPAKGGKRTRRRKPKKEGAQDLAALPAKETTKSKGWRQTPLLEPNPSFQPYATLKRHGRRNGKMEESGWATEDATDVQDMGDFDFQGSLAKFDKHSVFTQLQAEDSVADEDRLVAHNRIPKAKPGTGGGKNLHYTENVLDVPNGTSKIKDEVWKSEAGESELEERAVHRDAGSGSGRHSRRAESKPSTSRRPVSRKGSGILPGQVTRTLSVGDKSTSLSFLLTIIRCLHRLPSQLSTCTPQSAAVNQLQRSQCSTLRLLLTPSLACQKT